MNSYNFHFIRHLMSCNNITEGKIEFGGKDFDPSGTIYGIVETALLSMTSNEFVSNHVYVSNLIRTWITAFLLFGTNNKGILHLYVSPFLKEKHETFKRGNYPKEISHTIQKFEVFLKKLKVFSKSNVEILKELTIDWYNNLPKEVHIILPDTSNTFSQHIIFKKDLQTQDYVLSNFCNITDTVGPMSNNMEYLETGNVMKFMNWFTQNIQVKNNLIHVVTHSQVMQDYLLKTFNYDLNSESKVNQQAFNVRHSNSWRFITNLNTQILPQLQPGVPLNKKHAKKMEQIMKGYGKNNKLLNNPLLSSLCGKQGSIDKGSANICSIHNKEIKSIGGKKRPSNTKKQKKIKRSRKHNPKSKKKRSRKH